MENTKKIFDSTDDNAYNFVYSVFKNNFFWLPIVTTKLKNSKLGHRQKFT